MDDFVALCRSFGPLDELVQAGGGNISVKLDDRLMIVKSSGTRLGEVTRSSGHVLVRYPAVREALEEPCEPDIRTFIVHGNERPSLETYFHSFLRKYVVHLHPTLMNARLCSKGDDMVPYYKPGFELSREILRRYTGEPVVYLQNHGVIFTTDTLAEMYELVSSTYDPLYRPGFVRLHTFWAIQAEYPNAYIYKLPPAETREYLPVLKQYNVRPLTPDIAMFLHNAVRVEDDCIFLIGATKQTCLGIAEVLRCYCESVPHATTFLKEMDVADVLHCPNEVYRNSVHASGNLVQTASK